MKILQGFYSGKIFLLIFCNKGLKHFWENPTSYEEISIPNGLQKD